MTKEELLKTGGDKILIVDIREEEELVTSPSIPGAVHIPMGKIIREAEDGRLPHDKKIVTVCRSGGRCQMVNHELRELGYDVDWLEGGMMSW
jgi:sulfur dioxygenase